MPPRAHGLAEGRAGLRVLVLRAVLLQCTRGGGDQASLTPEPTLPR